jgi:hypothetical protein
MNDLSGIKKIGVDTIQNHPVVVLIMVIIIISFISYGLYYYFVNKEEYNYKYGSSYYGKKLIDYIPLFQIQTNNLEECISRCENDLICTGMTYDKDIQECVGTSGEGLLRQENNNLISWVKPQTQNSKTNIDYVKSIILGYENQPTILPAIKITRPYNNVSYAFSFNLCIRDYHHNYGKWKHIFHKGTPPSSNQPLDFNSWETLILNFNNQFIGVWLAPYNNNMRIAISTIYISKTASNYYEHANVQLCNNNECYISDVNKINNKNNTILSVAPQQIIKNIEFIDHDITNVPINKEYNYIINIINNNIEFYQEGKLVKSALLQGIPEYNNDNLFVLQPHSINGYIRNLAYYPSNLSLDDISKINNN